MTPFVPLDAPGLDFVVVSLAAHARHRFGPDVAQRLRSAGVEVLEVPARDGGLTLAVVADATRVVEVEGRRIGLSGLGRTARALVLPFEAPRAEELADLDPTAGQFALFSVGPDGASVRTDLFGMGHVHASQHDGMALAGDRLHLHRIVLEAFGEPVTVDGLAVAAALFSDHGFFAQQPALHRTLVAGVELVPLTQDVVVAGGRLHRVPRPDHEEAARGDATDYAALVAEGVQDVQENTRVALEDPRITAVILDLSGGKDSRLVLGAARGVPGWTRRVRVNAKDVPGSDDLLIAAGLVHRYGARYYEGDDAGTAPVTLEENLAFWRSYFFGSYNRLGLAAWSTRGDSRRSLTFSGGLGELYRAFWVPQLRRHLEGARTAQDFARSFVRGAARPGAYPEESLEQIAVALAAELDALPGRSLEERVEEHYLFHRNRHHMGLRGFSSRHERLTWFPLASRALYRAARALPFEERAAGRVVHDVMERLDPELLRLRFDGGDPFPGLARPLQDDPLALDESTADWQAAREHAARTMGERRRGTAPLLVWSEVQPAIRRTVDEAVARMREALPDAQTVLPADLEARVADAFDDAPGRANQLAMRILAVEDAAGLDTAV